MPTDPSTATTVASAAWSVKDIVVMIASLLSVLSVFAGLLVFATKAGDLRRTLIEAFRDLRALCQSDKLVLGALAKTSGLSSEAAAKVSEAERAFPGGFEDRLADLIAGLHPGGNPINEDELNEFRRLYEGAHATPPALSSDAAFRFYDLARKVAAELVQEAKAGNLLGAEKQRIPLDEVIANSDRLMQRAAFVLGYATTNKEPAENTSHQTG